MIITRRSSETRAKTNQMAWPTNKTTAATYSCCFCFGTSLLLNVKQSVTSRPNGIYCCETREIAVSDMARLSSRFGFIFCLPRWFTGIQSCVSVSQTNMYQDLIWYSLSLSLRFMHRLSEQKAHKQSQEQKKHHLEKPGRITE